MAGRKNKGRGRGSPDRKPRPRKRRAPAGAQVGAKQKALIAELRRVHCEEHKFVSRICRAWAELDRVRHQLQTIYAELRKHPQLRIPL